MSIKLIESGNGVKTSLMEQNAKNTQEAQAPTETSIKEAAASHGIQNWKEVLDLNRQSFSAKKFREGSYAVASKLKETNAEGMFGQLLRAGVQNTFNDIYQKVETTHEAAVRVVSSNKRQEFYSPLERIGFPEEVPASGSFPETSFKGLELEIINKKLGMMLAFERELFDDDQTGQIQSRASQLGENAKIYEEAYVWNRIFDGTMSLAGKVLPKSKTWSTVYSTTGLHGTGVGINATASGRLSQSQIQAGWVLAKKMVDQSGNPILVDPKLLAVSPQDYFFALTLLNSANYPSAVSTASADAGKVGGIMGVNPIHNLLAIVVSRFIPDYGAIMIDAGKGFAKQIRDPHEVVAENPASGAAFSQEVFRYKLRSRWEADFIDPKFFINLNKDFSA